MSREFQDLKRIYLEAAALPPAERAKFLDAECGSDPEIRHGVEELLAQDGESIDALARDGFADAIDDALRATAASGHRPESIGPYEILGELGRGGMGVVYRARQRHPIERVVALKLVRHGLDRDVFRRFATERRSIALMDHPNIARVLDAGADDSGNPYIVMELVDGLPITEHARRHQLSPDARIDLFLQVCRGLQHAHQKGVIHRDLKPSNVLVATPEGVPVPKIIDFGIAKSLTADTAGGLTHSGQIVGTLEYMSPEQAEGRVASVDTRSDIYSLGVILYELLGDRLPHELRGLPLTEAVRVLVEDPPLKLPTSFASGRRVDADLRTVLGKTMEKEPQRRYASVAALADDLERYGRNEPILAHPPSSLYQLRKLVSRHRLPFLFAGVLFALTLAFGLAKRQDQLRAEAEAAKARQLSEFLQGMLASAEPEHAGDDPTVRDVLDEAATELEAGLSGQPAVRGDLHRTLGNAYAALGRFEEAIHHLERAIELRRGIHGDSHEAIAEVQRDLADVLLGRDIDADGLARADSLASAALRVEVSTFGPSHPRVERTLQTLATSAFHDTRYAESESLYTEVLSLQEARDADPTDRAEVLSLLAKPLFYLNRAEPAEAAIRESLELRRRALGETHRTVAESQHDLAFLLSARDRNAEAESLFVASLDLTRRVLGDRHPAVAGRLSNLGSLYARTGKLREAEKILREARSIQVETLGPRNAHVAGVTNNLAHALVQLGKRGEASEMYREALAIWESSGADETPFYATGMHNLALSLATVGDEAGADSLSRRAVALNERILGPDDPRTALSEFGRSTTLRLAGRWTEAQPFAERALARFRESLGDDHSWTYAALSNLGSIRHGLADAARARALLEESVEVHHRSLGPQGQLLAETLTNLGRVHHDEGDLESARAHVERAEEMLEALTGEGHPRLGEVRLALADLLASAGRFGEAEEHWSSAREILERHGRPGHPRAALARLGWAVATKRWDEIDAEILRTALTHPANLAGERARARARALEGCAAAGRSDLVARIRSLDNDR